MNSKSRTGYTIGNRKVAIIGIGYVGSSIAYALALKDVAREIVMIDINQEKTDGEAKDIRHGLPGMGTADLYAGDYSDCADCDLIIVTAGRGRKPGESRLDLTNENIKIMRSVVDAIKEYYTRGVVLIISNPVDILTYKAIQWFGLPDGMVFGSGNILDSSRFVRTIADYLELSTGVVNGYVVGEHGDSQVPVWSHVTVGGIPIDEYCSDVGIEWNEEIMHELADRTKKMGSEIIVEKGRTHFGIATCVCQLADAIVNQRPTIASVCSELKGEHGCRDVALSVPSVVGPAGVQQRIREKWAPEEYRGFFDAVNMIRDTINSLNG
ncbi:L-lactate dehydrogenase [Pseudobutyrivibrio sp.]|uniref:L-lactate dehydrogenase n=1 Tax=Pseudobutyrivibrio sp. TaxID=2014367 RepID=UPI0025E05ABD|nr:L-lactate dehydrogenase [Pseudobutyrivibrio sp.]MBR5648291.1 L-lactate dehydrogenase [Pseudobutyrivibrio sp.]